MCFSNTCSNHRQWNWDGERIIHDSIVPSSRPPVGHRGHQYDMDVREFLVSERNIVMRRTLEIDLKRFVLGLPGANWELFCSRSPGSFDHRAHLITEYVAKEIRYLRTNGFDPWQLPEETLSLKSGDCEDRALLIASLLLASGISSFNVRVALGKFRAWFGANYQDFDHIWVMYKNESGMWQIIETGNTEQKRLKPMYHPTMPDRADYIPYYIFNDYHLWSMQPSSVYRDDNISLKQDWSSLHPEFAGWVHKSILNDALPKSICPPWVLRTLNQHFTSYLWRSSLTVDDVDYPNTYDPFDHFDNGYIDESWQRVEERLSRFRNANLQELDSFHKAAHGIADFYAHTSYAHFGKINNGSLELYSKNAVLSPLVYDENSRFNLVSGGFSTNTNLWDGSSLQAAQLCKGKIISGRYAQHGDSNGPIELVTFISSDLQKEKGFNLRGAFPHHNEIAVDDGKPSSDHILYTGDVYSQQYKYRYDAAVSHIREAFQQNWKESKK